LHCNLVLHYVSRTIIDCDISVFFRQRFRKITDELEDLPTEWSGGETLVVLVQQADGLFIYATTVCRFIRGDGQWPPQKLLDLLIIPDNGSSGLLQ
jgi:hypothetical protein